MPGGLAPEKVRFPEITNSLRSFVKNEILGEPHGPPSSYHLSMLTGLWAIICVNKMIPCTLYEVLESLQWPNLGHNLS